MHGVKTLTIYLQLDQLQALKGQFTSTDFLLATAGVIREVLCITDRESIIVKVISSKKEEIIGAKNKSLVNKTVSDPERKTACRFWR